MNGGMTTSQSLPCGSNPYEVRLGNESVPVVFENRFRVRLLGEGPFIDNARCIEQGRCDPWLERNGIFQISYHGVQCPFEQRRERTSSRSQPPTNKGF